MVRRLKRGWKGVGGGVTGGFDGSFRMVFEETKLLSNILCILETREDGIRDGYRIYIESGKSQDSPIRPHHLHIITNNVIDPLTIYTNIKARLLQPHPRPQTTMPRSRASSSDSKSDQQQQRLQNYDLFRESLSTTIIQPPTKPKCCVNRRGPCRKHQSHDASLERDVADLADFIEYLASEIFDCLPEKLKDLNYRSWRDNEKLQGQYTLPLTVECLSDINLDPTIEETLQTYNLIAWPSELKSTLPASPEAFLLPSLTDYITTATTPPPATRVTKTDHCEICGRWWIPLSYHHLIPRSVHDKVVKRGWHKKEDLQNVAWLCGACHKFVHQFKGNEELAREYYTVDRLMAEDEVRKWANWVGKLRWKGGNV